MGAWGWAEVAKAAAMLEMLAAPTCSKYAVNFFVVLAALVE